MAPVEDPSEEPAEEPSEESLAEPAVNEPSQADVDRLRVRCWACGLLIQLPGESVPEGKVAADIRFTCGGCGADNYPHSTGPAQPRGKSGTLKKWIGRFFLVVVPGIILYVGASSFYLLWGSTVCNLEVVGLVLGHIVTAVVIEFQILWNYFATVLTLPSSPRKGVEFGTTRAAENDRLKEWSLCRRCDAPRPPGTHHCSTCGRCIHLLDHHCVFVHNCIGYENRRNFVLFTGYAVIGCVYPLLALALQIYLDPSEFMRIFYPTCMPKEMQKTFQVIFRHRPYRAEGGFTLVPQSTLTLPWEKPQVVDEGFLPYRSETGNRCEEFVSIIALGLLFIAAIGVTLGVGTLFGQQMFLLVYDTTSLNLGNARLFRDCSPSYSGRCMIAINNVRGILGPARSWLWPSCGPYPPELGGRSPPPMLQLLEAVELPEVVQEQEESTKKEN